MTDDACRQAAPGLYRLLARPASRRLRQRSEVADPTCRTRKCAGVPGLRELDGRADDVVRSPISRHSNVFSGSARSGMAALRLPLLPETESVRQRFPNRATSKAAPRLHRGTPFARFHSIIRPSRLSAGHSPAILLEQFRRNSRRCTVTLSLQDVMRAKLLRPGLTLLVLLLVGGVAGLSAQEEPPARNASVAVGLLQYDLASNGLAPMLAVRVGTPISSVLVLEGALAAGRPEQLGASSTLLIPEAQVQLSLPFTRILPFMGLGVGAALDLGGESSVDLTISGSLGVRAWIGEQMGIVGEYRGRGIGLDFERTASEYTIALSRRI